MDLLCEFYSQLAAAYHQTEGNETIACIDGWSIYIAMQLKDVSLSDAVAEFLIDNALTLSAEGRASALLFRLVECAAADPDRDNGRRVLSARLEALAFVVAPIHLPDVGDSLKILQRLDAELAQMLGKALAVARLGAKAA